MMSLKCSQNPKPSTLRVFYRPPACECSAEGSRSSECDVLSGQCVCKENVEGRRCDRCKPGFFNMRREDPDGCQG